MAVAPKKRKKVLPIIFMIDTSGSMKGKKIDAVNTAMADIVTDIKALSLREMDIDYTVRVLMFSNGKVEWKYGSIVKGVPLADYNWTNISHEECKGNTPLGECVEDLLKVVEDGKWQEYLGRSLAAPFILLISDGMPNGKVDVKEAVGKVFATQVGGKSVCVSIGIDTKDDQVASAILESFGKDKFIQADGGKPQELVELIKTVTVGTITRISTGNQSIL